MAVCLLRHALLTFLKTPFLRVIISTFKSGCKQRKGRATCIPEQLGGGGLKSGLEVSSASSHQSSQALTFPSSHFNQSTLVKSRSPHRHCPHILLFLLLLSLHLLMVFTINPSLVLLACSKQMERRLRLPLASLSLSSLHHPSCAAPPRLCTHSNNVSIPPESVIPVPPALCYSDVSILCTYSV